MDQNNDTNNHSLGDTNPEKFFMKNLNRRFDITHILTQEAQNYIELHDTNDIKNAKVSLQITHKKILANIKDLDNYLQYLSIIAGAEGYESERTDIVIQNYPSRSKEHEDIKQQIETPEDTILLPDLTKILARQENILKAIKKELPKVNGLVKTNILELAEDQKIFNDLQQTAEHIAIKGMLLSDFANTDKHLLDPIDRKLFQLLRDNNESYAEEADNIQTEITSFLGKRMAIEHTTQEIYDNYKTLRKKANTYEGKVHDYYQLMLKYDQ